MQKMTNSVALCSWLIIYVFACKDSNFSENALVHFSKSWLSFVLLYRSRLFSSRRNCRSPIVTRPLSSRRRMILSRTTIIFLKESSTRSKGRSAFCCFSSSGIMKADWIVFCAAAVAALAEAKTNRAASWHGSTMIIDLCCSLWI